MIAVKRIFRDLPFMLLLGFIIIIPFLGYKAGENIHTPPFGFVCESDTDDGVRLVNEFESAGFIRCADEAELKNEIGEAHLDCGVIVDKKLSDKLHSGQTDGTVKLITSPETLMAELCRAEAVSALSIVYSPYVTADSLEGTADLKDVKDIYYSMIDKGKLFAFSIENVDGKKFTDISRSVGLFTGCLSILMFITAFIAVCRPVLKHWRSMSKRLGKPSSFGLVLIPEFILRMLLMTIAGILAVVIAGQTNMLLPVVYYSLLVNISGLLLSILLPESYIIVITVFVSILSLGICPVFTDLTSLIPFTKGLRYILLPYYLWLF